MAGACIKMCVYVCVCARTLVWECAWRLQDNLVCDSLVDIYFGFFFFILIEDRVSHLPGIHHVG